MIGCYVIGEPGSGKSTLLRTLLPPPVAVRKAPVPHSLYAVGDRIVGAQLGVPHPQFPGTDRLSMAVQPAAIDWVLTAPVPALVGEGDRLSTSGFLAALCESCTVFRILWIDTPEPLAEERRQARGSRQDPRWVAGRKTKVRRLVDTFSHLVERLDGSLAPDALAAVAREASTALDFLAGSGAAGHPHGGPFSPL